MIYVAYVIVDQNLQEHTHDVFLQRPKPTNVAEMLVLRGDLLNEKPSHVVILNIIEIGA